MRSSRPVTTTGPLSALSRNGSPYCLTQPSSTARGLRISWSDWSPRAGRQTDFGVSNRRIDIRHYWIISHIPSGRTQRGLSITHPIRLRIPSVRHCGLPPQHPLTFIGVQTLEWKVRSARAVLPPLSLRGFYDPFISRFKASISSTYGWQFGCMQFYGFRHSSQIPK